jgi:flagellar basal-body rod protein FlgF
MSDWMEVTASDLGALTRQYRAITHNLANVSTIGYKQRISQFQHVMNDSLSHENSSSPGEGTLGQEIQSSISIDFHQGALQDTGNPLDVALNGEGVFFVVETDQGPLYTRNGSWRTNPQGQIVDALGRGIAGENGPITLPGNVSLSDLCIGSDGTISAKGNSLGRIRLAYFENPEKLTPVGHNCFQAPQDLRPTAPKDFTVYQGRLEQSNVSAVEELVNLIQVTRLYEAGVKTITSQDDRYKDLLRVAQG